MVTVVLPVGRIFLVRRSSSGASGSCVGRSAVLQIFSMMMGSEISKRPVILASDSPWRII